MVVEEMINDDGDDGGDGGDVDGDGCGDERIADHEFTQPPALVPNDDNMSKSASAEPELS